MKTNPVTGYIEDEESPIKKYLDNENIPQRISGEESTDDFPIPRFPPEVAAIVKAPSYIAALSEFVEYYDSNRYLNSDTTLIPYGSGAFEAWWCGKDSEDYPNAVHSPQKTITIQDINSLEVDDLLSLYSNIFYNEILTGLPEPVLIALVARIIKSLNVLPASYEELFEDNGIFSGVPYDAVLQAISKRRITPFATELVQRFLHGEDQ